MATSRILRELKSCAQKRPLLVNSIIYGSFYTGAEFAQQTYNKVFKFPVASSVPQGIEESNTIDAQTQSFPRSRTFNEPLILSDEDSRTRSSDYNDNYNWAQLERYAIYGCFIAGPVLHGWYKWLDAFYKGKTMKIVLLKLFADQFILTPPLITVFFISMSFMEQKADILSECKAKFLQTFKTSCMYWLPVQFFNFLLIPPPLRVSFVSVAAFCWVNILCYVKRVPLSE
ncbi:PXMP2/4 family protein 4-like [Halictus rubicundus]|uniref:PXMP2/4 family protein 4-like n=1 Tax=Halictus rubicundus TaxID=77578 RepID=UPI0040361D0B